MTVPPALTPEEWAEVFAQIERAPIVLGRGHQVVACIECSEDGSEDFHAAAAIALANQPYGFTREEVAALRIAMEGATLEYVRGGMSQSQGRPLHFGERLLVQSAIEKILALLPPE